MAKRKEVAGRGLVEIEHDGKIYEIFFDLMTLAEVQKDVDLKISLLQDGLGNFTFRDILYLAYHGMKCNPEIKKVADVNALGIPFGVLSEKVAEALINAIIGPAHLREEGKKG